jgi:hypothetical protein
MKLIKAIAFASVVAIAANAQAQTEYAPEQGDFSVELQFNPFSNNFSTFKLDQFKGRYFLTDKDALRFGIGFGVSNSKNTADPEDAEDVWSKTTEGSFSINLGYERNVYSYKRINLYAGAGLSFELNRVSTTEQKEYTMGYNDNTGDPIKEIHSVKSINGGNTFNAFYVNAFTGIDFFVYKGLYLGAELGLKIGVKNFPSSYKKGGFKVDENDQPIVTGGMMTWDDDYETKKGPKSNGFELGLYAEPAIRLGWQF